MTRDDIIRIAREAGLTALLRDTQKTHEALERFAALVAAEVGIAQWHRGYAEGQSVERAACAQIAEMEPCMTHTPHRIAAAIRARSEQ